MSQVARDPLAELARLLPTVLDESALHELAARLQPLLPAGEPPDTGKRLYSRDASDKWLTSTIEMTDNGPRRRPRRRQSVLPEHSLRAAFRDP